METRQVVVRLPRELLEEVERSAQGRNLSEKIRHAIMRGVQWKYGEAPRG